MRPPPSDALVFFGASGDLAFKKVFPALAGLCRRGRLEVPIVGVAKSGWTRDNLVQRAKDSLVANKCFDEATFERLAQRLRYVDGDYNEASTFTELRNQLGPTLRPCTTLPFRRACSRSWPSVSRRRTARREHASSSRSLSVATSLRRER